MTASRCIGWMLFAILAGIVVPTIAARLGA